MRTILKSGWGRIATAMAVATMALVGIASTADARDWRSHHGWRHHHWNHHHWNQRWHGGYYPHYRTWDRGYWRSPAYSYGYGYYYRQPSYGLVIR